MSRVTMQHVRYFALIVCLLTSFVATADAAVAFPEDKKVRVGVFDSRAIAVAYYRSSDFNTIMKKLHAEHKKAKASGDAKLAQECENRGKAMNDLAHQQGFGTGSVDAILKKVKEQLPAIAKSSNVQVIVSRWNLTYQEKDAEFVDVTDQLVMLFNPDETTRKMINDLRKKVPIENNKDH